MEIIESCFFFFNKFVKDTTFNFLSYVLFFWSKIPTNKERLDMVGSRVGDFYELKASLVYIERSRPVRIT